MLKYILALFFSFSILVSFLIIGCSDDVAVFSSSKPLSITKAPADDIVSIFQTISLEFSDDLDASTITDSSAYIMDISGNHVGLHLDIGSPANKVVFTPYQYFKPSSAYTLVITTAIKNTAGESLSTDYVYIFTTQADSVDTSTITLVDINPHLATADISTEISLEFNKFISPEAQYNGPDLLSMTCSESAISGDIEFFNSVVRFKPTVALPAGANCTINLVGIITDMYGNIYTGPSSWNFTTDATEIGDGGYNLLPDSSIDVGTAGYLLCYYPLGGGDQDMIAVAKDGGIDFYYLNAGTFEKQPFSLSIASAVTEMVFVDGPNLNDAMLISTMNDGIYKVQTNGTNSTVSRYLENESGIYGIAYGKDGSGVVDRIYAVGPQMGMKIFTVDGNGDMTFDKTVSINGEPLKVVGYTYSLAALIRKTYVSDYTNGVRVFDENGTFESLVDVNGTIKHIASSNDTIADNIYAINTIGNIYAIDAGSPTTAFFVTSIFSNVNDMNYDLFSSKLYISTTKDGYFNYTPNYMVGADTKILLKSSGNIVSSINAGGWNITLDSDGTLNIYEISEMVP